MIFLVDDDPIQNMLTSKLIETVDASLDLKVFHNGEEVLEGISGGLKPSMILLDINMPIMDGWEFLEEYVKQRRQAKVVMLSSSNMPEDRARTDEFECVVDYFLKPITVADIEVILSKYYQSK